MYKNYLCIIFIVFYQAIYSNFQAIISANKIEPFYHSLKQSSPFPRKQYIPLNSLSVEEQSGANPFEWMYQGHPSILRQMLEDRNKRITQSNQVSNQSTLLKTLNGDPTEKVKNIQPSSITNLTKDNVNKVSIPSKQSSLISNAQNDVNLATVDKVKKIIQNEKEKIDLVNSSYESERIDLANIQSYQETNQRDIPTRLEYSNDFPNNKTYNEHVFDNFDLKGEKRKVNNLNNRFVNDDIKSDLAGIHKLDNNVSNYESNVIWIYTTQPYKHISQINFTEGSHYLSDDKVKVSTDKFLDVIQNENSTSNEITTIENYDYFNGNLDEIFPLEKTTLPCKYGNWGFQIKFISFE